MSWFTSWFATAEADVLKIIQVIKTEEQVLASDINKALKWVADNTPAIAADIQQVLSLVQILGIADPRVQVAVTTAHEAIAALDAYAKAYNSGTGTPQAVVAGYAALKSAQAAASTAASVAVSTPTPTVAKLMG